MKKHLPLALIGLLFGFAQSRMGFSTWDEVSAMLRLADLRLLLTFFSAVALLTVLWSVVRRVSSPNWPVHHVHPGTLMGGSLFGIGWALSGACPSTALVQLGEGQLPAVLTLAGILGGNWLYSVANARYFRLSTGSCTSD